MTKNEKLRKTVSGQLPAALGDLKQAMAARDENAQRKARERVNTCSRKLEDLREEEAT